MRVKNNKEAWNKLFEEYDIVNEVKINGYFIIMAKQINEYREARLMTKFDNSKTLPEIFIKNKLEILPITRGSYMISNFITYKDFEKSNSEIEKISFPEYIQSLDYNNISIESMAINCAYITKILEKFLGEEELVPTVNGRMGSGKFNFQIKRKNDELINIEVENSQIEIDGGYEGINSLALIEAKNYFSDDFIVRQLYYPYRLWSGKITKPVRPIYIIYSNDIFNVYEYKFENKDEYTSIKLVKNKRYSVEDTEIVLDEIQEIFDKIEIVKEPEISFPQADKFERIINLCELLERDSKSKNYITDNYAFDSRQTNYYTDAARYLGIVEKSKGKEGIIFGLTDKGKRILNLKYKNRQKEFVKLILEHEVFNQTYKLYMKKFGKISTKDVIELMKECNLYNIGEDSTYKRRASTIKGWINWVIEIAN